MKIKTLEIKAVIPTAQYANIQPGIQLEDVELKEGSNFALGFIKDMFSKYSASGSLIENISMKIEKQSFNENVIIGFDSTNHTYGYNGKSLTSATDYIQKFYKKFDKKSVSKSCSKSWEVEQCEVEDLWDSNGKLSSAFGNVIHQALEHYDKFKFLGQKVSDKKGEKDNYCLPKHPMLKAIIQGFTRLEMPNGTVIPEALITDVKNGFCGHADRILILDIEKKICRVQDYKVNVECEKKTSDNKALPPFENLPPNKLTKYQLQMSFYANMLQKSGWVVEGLDVFVFEESWKHYKLNVLQII